MVVNKSTFVVTIEILLPGCFPQLVKSFRSKVRQAPVVTPALPENEFNHKILNPPICHVHNGTAEASLLPEHPPHPFTVRTQMGVYRLIAIV